MGQRQIKAGQAGIVTFGSRHGHAQANEAGYIRLIRRHGAGRQHAVTVVGIFGGGGQSGGNLLPRNCRSAFRVGRGKHQAGGGQHFRAFRRVFAQVVQGQVRGALPQTGRAFNPLADPGHSGQQVGGADASVPVFVQQAQGGGVKFQPFGGAAQSHPELGVKAVKVTPFVVGKQQGLIQTGHAPERKGGNRRMGGGFHGVSRLRLCGGRKKIANAVASGSD